MDTYKIMIVDDEADAREGIVHRIDWGKLGFDAVIEAENGQDALEKAESLKMDVILTDIKMPFLDGLEMSRRITLLYPAVKIVLLSGFDDFKYAQEAIRLNVVEYVLKPVNVAEITQVLMRVKKLLDDGIAQRLNMRMLMESYSQALPLMRERFLTELLWGAVTDEQIAAQMEKCGLGIGDAPFRVVATFEAEKNPQATSVVSWDLVPVSIKQMLEEQLEKRCKHAVFISSAYIIAVTAWENPNPIGVLASVANDICARCAKYLNATVTAGIGRSREKISGVHESFLEARSALEYKVVAGGGKAICIQDMEMVRINHEAFGARDEERLLYAVKFGGESEICECIDSLLGQAKELGSWQRKAHMLSLLSVICRIMENHGLDEDEDGEWSKLMASLGDPGDGMRDSLRGICLRLSGSLSVQRETVPKQLTEKAKAFIASHYAEHDLSVERVCEHLHVSQSYFFTIFKQETGETFVRHLTGLRMAKACELLGQSWKTYEVARLVGYEDANYFSYMFKKWFGMSPTRYRASLPA
jgi:two-component system response regulator YesN